MANKEKWAESAKRIQILAESGQYAGVFKGGSMAASLAADLDEVRPMLGRHPQWRPKIATAEKRLASLRSAEKSVASRRAGQRARVA